MTHSKVADHQAAQAAYEQGDLRTAMKLVCECLAVDRDDGRALEMRGLVHYSGGNFQESVASLERASLMVPLRPSGRVCLGHAYAKIGRTSLSRDLLRELIHDTSLSILLLLHVASGLNAVDRPDLAMEACRNAMKRDDTVAQAHYDLGFYAGRCGYPDEVIESLARKAVDLAPDVVRYRVGLAGLLWRQDRTDEAYEFVRNLVNDDLVSICCSCCLKRIIDMYERAHDYRRVVVCRQRLLQLEASQTESDCE